MAKRAEELVDFHALMPKKNMGPEQRAAFKNEMRKLAGLIAAGEIDERHILASGLSVGQFLEGCMRASGEIFRKETPRLFDEFGDPLPGD